MRFFDLPLLDKPSCSLYNNAGKTVTVFYGREQAETLAMRNKSRREGYFMTSKRAISLMIALFMLITAMPWAVSAASSLTLSLSSSLNEAEQPSLGDSITYTVAVTENEQGFVGGTLYVTPSPGLTYESATLLGEEYSAEIVIDGGAYDGSYAISWLSKEPYTETTTSFCTVTFRVTALGEVSLTVNASPFIDAGTSEISTVLSASTVSHTVETPDTPVITTDTLEEALLNESFTAVLRADVSSEFLTFEIAEGRLPEGLTLMSNGMLSGTPTEAGEFVFAVAATIAGVVMSEPKTLTLTVLEKPRQLELIDGSSYAIDAEGYLIGVVERTDFATLLAQFKHSADIQVFDAKQKEITSEQTLIGTGCTVSLMRDDAPIHTVTVVVRGDIDGNARIGSIDYTNIRMHYLKLMQLSGAALKAADTDGNGRIGSMDYANVRLHYLKLSNLYDN
ncbi:MAG: hypothetical protein E7618_07065 [Ruminococcaceae bacterium]|nr:hypothetical protein [Oscillospiraceae bacterium]